MATKKPNQPSYLKYKGMTPRQAGIKYETSSEQDATIGKWLAANDPKGTKYKTAQAYIDSNGKLTTKRAIDAKNFHAGKEVNGATNKVSYYGGRKIKYTSGDATGWKPGGGHKREFLLDVGRAARKNIVANDRYMEEYAKTNPEKAAFHNSVAVQSSKYGARKSVRDTERIYMHDHPHQRPIDKNSHLGRKMTEINNKRPLNKLDSNTTKGTRVAKDNVYSYEKWIHQTVEQGRYSRGTQKYDLRQGAWQKPNNKRNNK